MVNYQPITTHSMLASFSRCPRQAMYAYVDQIQPITISRPLKMGTWFHYLLESHYGGNDWREKHQELIERHEELFFEEQMGDVPVVCERLMRSYLWHYQLEKKYGWKVIAVELELKTTWPDGTEYWGKTEALAEINCKLWIVDHKLRSQFPTHLQRLLDHASLLYIWAAHRNGIKVEGFIWNYVRMKAPTIPQINKDGTLSKRKIETDYPTLHNTIKENKIEPHPYELDLRRLRAMHWRPGKDMPEHPFFRRVVFDKDPDTVARIVKSMHRTKKNMQAYDFSDRDTVARVVDNSCDYRCSYPLICSTELFGGNTEQVLRLNYRKADPFGYYNSNQ